MADDQRVPVPYWRVWLIGAGTVFACYTGVMTLLLVDALIPWGAYRPSFGDRMGLVAVSGIVGGLVALTIVVGLTIPMLVLWIPLFRYLTRIGYTFRSAAIRAAGFSAFVGVFCVNLVGGWLGAFWVPPIGWILFLIPTVIAMAVAGYVFRDPDLPARQ